MTVGDRIRALRKEKGLTQKELGQKLGVSASMIGQYETNVRKPKFETLEKIAVSLGVNITEIVDISDISPSLNVALPVIDSLKDILKSPPTDGKILLSDEERNQIKGLGELLANLPEELSNSAFLIDVLKSEYISLFDKLNFRGKYLAVKAVYDMARNPDLAPK